MADEDINVDDGQVDGAEIDGDKTDGNEVDIAKQSDGDFMSDTVNKIKETQKILSDEDDDGGSDIDNTDDDSDVISELAGKDIPDAFSTAAEAAGMTASEIIAFADKHTDEELMEMIPTLESSLEDDNKKDDDDKGDKQDDKTGKDVDDKEIDPELIKSVTDKISKQLEEKFGTTLEQIDKFKAYQEEQSTRQMVDRASKFFDEASKEFPVFGKTDELPRFPSGSLKGQLIPTSPEMKARNEVLSYADAFMDKGADIDDAMAKAYATYKGLHLEKESKRKAIRDLKNHEVKLSGARVGRETKRKYLDTRDEIIDDIRQMKRAAGIE